MQNINLDKIRQLLNKYLEGKTSLEEEQILLAFFQQDQIPEELKIYQEEFIHYASFKKQKSGNTVKSTIDKLLSEREAQKVRLIEMRMVQLAAAVVLMIISFLAGFHINSNHPSDQELITLKQEILELKERTISLMLQQESSHEKIRALVMASHLQPVGETLMNRIIQTLYEENHPLVKSAALDLIGTYKASKTVQALLMDALQKQEAVSIQLELIRIIVEAEDEDLILQLKRLLEAQKLHPAINHEMKTILSLQRTQKL